MGRRSLAFWVLVVGAAAWPARSIVMVAWTVWENSRRRISAFELVARGLKSIVSDMGPWTLSDLMLGLSALAKVAEKEPPEVPGTRLEELEHDPCFLAEVQHWRAVAEAAYAESAVQWSLQTGLPESALLSSNFSSSVVTLRPAYVVAIDAAFGAVVVAVRGTRDMVDVLVDVAAAPHHSLGSWCHGGFIHSASVLLEEVQPFLTRAINDYPSFEIVCIGHSLGAGVATLLAFFLRKEQLNVRCWAFAPPACVDERLANLCNPFTTSIIANNDLVPRFSAASVERLREEICGFDWDKVIKLAEQDDSWRMLANAAASMKQLQKMYITASKKIQELDRALDFRRTPISCGQGLKQTGNLLESISREESDLGGSMLSLAIMVDHNLESGLPKDSLNTQDKEDIKMQSSLFSQSLEVNVSSGTADSFPESSANQRKAMENYADLCHANERIRNTVALYPPGKLYVLSCISSGGVAPVIRLTAPYIRSYGVFPSYEQAQKLQWTLSEASIEDFQRIVVSPWCLSDHMLSTIGIGLDCLQRKAPPVISILRSNCHLSTNLQH